MEHLVSCPASSENLKMVTRKLCYIIVVDNEEVEKDSGRLTFCHSDSKTSFRYTRSVLQNVLQLVGCKVHHAFKISRRVFDTLESMSLQNYFKDMSTEHNKPVDLYKKQTSVTVKREKFLDAICISLEEYRYVGPSQRSDIMLACRLRERKESVTILLCGTSGCGKSTLSSILASKLGITTVVSTDSVRHMMRSFIAEKDNPLLWASTYHAGEFLDPSAVAKAKSKRRDKKLSTSHGSGSSTDSFSEAGSTGTGYMKEFSDKNDFIAKPIEQVGTKVLAIEGYKAQSEMVIDSLDKLITTWEDRKESVVVEGVHLSLNFVMGLMKKHPSIIPFLIYIADEEKHLERFAIRAKYMTLDPSKNKYVKYIRNIRTIQDYLCKRADKHLVPKVNNTNVDRSVASIHLTVFSCLRRREIGVNVYDIATNTVKAVHEEYTKQCDANSICLKGMFRMIQRQGSLRRYMAIVNSDGSVTKAWPFTPADKEVGLTLSSGRRSEVGSPIYGPVRVCEVGHVNVQFGDFGIGSWPNDTESTSNMGSVNGSTLDDEYGNQDSTPSGSSTNIGHLKELTQDEAVSESEEEPPYDDEGDSSDPEEFEDEFEGSVAELSIRSDEEYDEEQMDGTFNSAAADEAEVSGNNSHLCNSCHHGEQKHSICCLRTLSMKPSTRHIHGGMSYRRVHSLPLRNSRSKKI